MATEPSTWLHYCLRDRNWFEVGSGEECNWCGKRESDPDQLDRLRRLLAHRFSENKEVPAAGY